jgi:hypothetical protein
MPRSSHRQRVLGRLKNFCSRRLRGDIYRELLFDSPDGGFNIPSDSTLHCWSIYDSAKKRRYLVPRTYRKRDCSKMHAEIYDVDQRIDKEFLFHYRVTRESLLGIYILI